LQVIRWRVLEWRDKVVMKVEENAGLCLIALSQGLVSDGEARMLGSALVEIFVVLTYMIL
jgi:hypothetical protein